HVAHHLNLHSFPTRRSSDLAIFIALNGKLVGIISIADKIRDDAKAAIKEMRRNGIKRIIMLTGDNQHTAQAVANQLELDEFHAEDRKSTRLNSSHVKISYAV